MDESYQCGANTRQGLASRDGLGGGSERARDHPGSQCVIEHVCRRAGPRQEGGWHLVPLGNAQPHLGFEVGTHERQRQLVATVGSQVELRDGKPLGDFHVGARRRHRVAHCRGPGRELGVDELPARQPWRQSGRRRTSAAASAACTG
jgi:hypothetical protein